MTETFSNPVAMSVDTCAEAWSVLRAAAVFDRRFDWSLIVAMTGLDADRVLEVLWWSVRAPVLEAVSK